jgi:exopolysaccharide biosynthesis polyprenyl glycosylphosphotransferase
VGRYRYTVLFLVQDFVLSYGAWLVFWIIRKTSIETDLTWAPYHWTWDLFVKAGITAVCWLGVYWVAGLYRMPHRRSRLKDTTLLLQFTAVGVLGVAFFTFLNDPLPGFDTLRLMVIDYFLVQFGAVWLVRMVAATVMKRLMIRGRIGFNTLIVGCGEVAHNLLNELKDPRRAPGFRIRGYVRIPECNPNLFLGRLKRLGDLEHLAEVIRKRRIEEVIIALDKKEQNRFLDILRATKGTPAKLNVVPDMYDLLVGNVKLSNVYGSPLVEVSPHLMPPWQAFAKRAIDIAASALALIVLAPIMLVIAIVVKLDSKGPVFYTQERIGKGGKPFRIIKFRSMRTDAEQGTPRLSSDRDPRITRVGAFLRKSHFDEFPQFWNVLRGDMSLVGPRPERQFFIDQIMARAPEYAHLQKVRPGVTSWGQVKYGYAENVDQMVERLKYDLIYIENMSLSLDIKIMLYTLLRMIEGDGK